MISQVLPKFSQLQVQAASSCRFHVLGLPNDQFSSNNNNNSSSNARILTKLPRVAPVMPAKSMWSSDKLLTPEPARRETCYYDNG
ncbi:hypothetical protein Ancab_022868, partial [Ancistrocladus abbreviatus]